ncbi:flavodoxin family protein [Bifidobacterium cebidarum]|uniref:NADPH-dependent FMN reductase n=1 Tax=Bifidobacterium cebidarum TaxID=2650773 RepID=A0A6I1GDQ0_9BIFI|nr:flavodoxin family protein [Bifidobacterium cebidarum]KAB7786564.1 NADPH-dependent FMN reductase [Bifidobacterium cebidarum]
MSKHILVIQGSPTKGGNADMLADAFIEGVEAAGNTATKLTLADMNIAPFTGYDQPADDMAQVMEQMKSADGIVIATPTYWMQFSAQIKAMMDRLPFDAHDDLAGKESVLLVAGASPEEVLTKNVFGYYQMCFGESLGWKIKGSVIAAGVFAPGQVAGTPYLEKARELGREF